MPLSVETGWRYGGCAVFYQGIRRLCWHKSENRGEDANRTQKVAVFQSREGTEGEGEPARKKKRKVNTDQETWFAGC